MIIPALKKTYFGRIVLDTPEMEIRDGSIVAVCGQNGSGKSTFARILAGIVQDDEGKGRDLKTGIGYMSQQTLAFRLSVRKNLMLNADPAASAADRNCRADLLLAALGLSDAAGKRADKLSGGQIQRMGLARILMKQYKLLILDEPTSSMDQQTIPVAERLIKEYQEQTGCTVILITHSPEQSERLAEEVIVLEDGKVSESKDIPNILG